MYRRTPLLLLALLLPAHTVHAQEGSVAFQHSVKIEFEIPEQLRARLEQARPGGREGQRPGGGPFPTERVSQVVLIFDGARSLMSPVPEAEEEAQPRRARPGADDPLAGRRAGMLARMRMASASRADRETLMSALTDFESGRIVEQREFLGRTFLIEDERPSYAWKLTGEQAEFLGYVVQKATAVQDSSVIEAWFTPQIPVQAGPGPYGGLPGMILVVSVDDGREQYTATAVSLSEVGDGVIVEPEDGEVVTREEYEAMVAEKLEELRMTRGRRR